jgi:hypothetical protein
MNSRRILLSAARQGTDSKQFSHSLGHVWTAPAVQEESDYPLLSRVQPCIRPVFARRFPSVAMQPLWLLAMM